MPEQPSIAVTAPQFLCLGVQKLMFSRMGALLIGTLLMVAVFTHHQQPS
jgi:hypothetical protein